MRFRENALDAAARGWPVLPLNGKVPLTSHGFKDATTDPGQIERWAAQWPGANVGIRTGAASGLSVLDIDPRHDGDESLHLLERDCSPLPETVSVKTGGGGEHLYFRHPGGHVRSGPFDLERYPGIDLKADDAYVVAAGSIHPKTGGPYEYDRHPDELSIAASPAVLLARSDPATRANSVSLDARRRRWDEGDGFSLDDRTPVEYVRLIAGIEAAPGMKIACPFPDHDDRTPSLHIYESAERGWYCYGCRRGGGIYEFAACLAGVPLPVRGADFLDVEAALTAMYERALGVA